SVQLGSAGAELGTRVEPGIGRARYMFEMQDDGLRRIAWMAVAAEAYRKVEGDAAVERHRRGDVVDLEPDPGPPIPHQHVRVHERRLDVLRQGGALRLRQIRR